MYDVSIEEAERELFDGVGPKTASCVLSFCLRRDSFTIDTYAVSLLYLERVSHRTVLEWVPQKANGEQLFAHLDTCVLEDSKYCSYTYHYMWAKI